MFWRFLGRIDTHENTSNGLAGAGEHGLPHDSHNCIAHPRRRQHALPDLSCFSQPFIQGRGPVIAVRLYGDMTHSHNGAGVNHVSVPIVACAGECNGKHYTETDGDTGDQGTTLSAPEITPCYFANFHFLILSSDTNDSGSL